MKEDYQGYVLQNYPRKHPALFDPAELPRFLDPSFAEALREGAPALRLLWAEEARGLFKLRILTQEFCETLLDECEHFEAWCLVSGVEIHRPNTMNNHGAILDDFGLEAMMQAIMTDCVQPLSFLAGFSDVVGGGELLSHHAFVVSCACPAAHPPRACPSSAA